MRGPRNLPMLQREAARKQRLEALDSEIAQLAADGYMVEADRLLEERHELVDAVVER